MTWNRSSGLSTDTRTRGRAKAMRHAPTEAERKLWWALRHDLALQGTHFRRQVPIGPYVVDFLCLAARLIVEVDGEQHGFDAGRRHDANRAAYLEAQGFRVLRFWNRQVLMERPSVIDTIHSALAERVTTPTPCPSPQGGGDAPASRPCGD